MDNGAVSGCRASCEPAEPPNGQETIALAGVHKTFAAGGGHVPVLADIHLRVERGERLAIVGRSGSGKTTLLNIMGGVDGASGGQVSVCGQRLDLLNAAGLTTFRREYLGFIFQFFNLFPTLTAWENVALGAEAARPARAAAALAEHWLDAVGLAHRADSFPQQLSGGEQQRVAIARALAKEPTLLLADEPTGNLDAESARRVLDVMADVQQRTGVTIVFATHDPAVVALATRTLELRAGRLVPTRALDDGVAR